LNIVTWVLLDATPAPKPIDKSRVEPGWIALVLLVVLGGAVALLWFSLRKQLGRIDVGRHLRERAGPPPPVGGGTNSPAAGGASPPPPGSPPPTPPTDT
jgi:hypothetical protein